MQHSVQDIRFCCHLAVTFGTYQLLILQDLFSHTENKTRKHGVLNIYNFIFRSKEIVLFVFFFLHYNCVQLANFIALSIFVSHYHVLLFYTLHFFFLFVFSLLGNFSITSSFAQTWFKQVYKCDNFRYSFFQRYLCILYCFFSFFPLLCQPGKLTLFELLAWFALHSSAVPFWVVNVFFFFCFVSLLLQQSICFLFVSIHSCLPQTLTSLNMYLTFFFTHIIVNLLFCRPLTLSRYSAPRVYLFRLVCFFYALILLDFACFSIVLLISTRPPRLSAIGFASLNLNCCCVCVCFFFFLGCVCDYLLLVSIETT